MRCLHSVLFTVLVWSAWTASVESAPLPKPKKETSQATPEVHAVGVYEATCDPRVAPRFPNSLRVQVQTTNKRPVILVLSAYEPVRWEINAPSGAVAQVIVSGYHKQTVLGLPKGTPVRSLVYEDKNEEYFIAFRDPKAADLTPEDRAEAQQAYEQMTKKVKELSGQELKFFRGRYGADRVTIRPGEKPTFD